LATSAQTPQKFVKDGVEIEFTVDREMLAGQDAVFRFKIHDTSSKTPLSGVRPAVWVAQRERPGPPGPDQCRAKIESFLQGSLRSRPDVDLNTYYLLTLNQEPNLSVIDPLLGFGGSKLLALVLLKSPGEDWALTNDRLKLFVSMPRVNQVAIVDTTTWKVIANIDTGVKPSRLGLQPDEKYLWVANENGVTVIDTVTLKPVTQISTGAGTHEIAFGANNKFAFVTNRNDGTLSIISVQKLRKLKDVKTGAPASALAYSPLSNALYVGNEGDGSVAAVDASSHKLIATIQTAPGLKTVRFARGGRWGFVANTVDSNVYIFDASTNRLVHKQAVGEAPDQFAFTDNFAYVRSLGSDQVSAISSAHSTSNLTW
jgi:YVTN family beta-propeller protein